MLNIHDYKDKIRNKAIRERLRSRRSLLELVGHGIPQWFVSIERMDEGSFTKIIYRGEVNGATLLCRSKRRRTGGVKKKTCRTK